MQQQQQHSNGHIVTARKMYIFNHKLIHILCGGRVKEAAMARVRCAWAKFKELSLILTAMWCIIPHKGKDI